MGADREQEALIAAGNITVNSRVLDLGWEGECLPLQGANHWFVSDDIRAVRRSCVPMSVHADEFLSLEGQFDAVFYRPLQRATKEQVFSWIDGAFAKLMMGGRLCLAGRRDRGVESYAARVKSVFGAVEKVAQVGKTRIYCATRRDAYPGIAPVKAEYAFETADFPGGPYRFKTRAGVFSWDGVDVGSRLLIAQVDVSRDAHVLDLGCGYGFLGILCAGRMLRGRVRMVDVSFRAVQCARGNIAENGLCNAFADVSDGYECAGDMPFDLILSNPPFHEGNAVGHPFIEGAAERLKPDGRLMMVVMRSKPYRQRMQRVFQRVEVLEKYGGYEILCASGKNEA